NGLMDLLKACQKEGLVRLERDRRGGLRVFQGAALLERATSEARPAPDAATTSEAAYAGDQIGNAYPDRPTVIDEADVLFEADTAEAQPIPVDTTAELLG